MKILILSIIIAIVITALVSIILKIAFKRKFAIYSENNDTNSIKNLKAIKLISIIMALILSFLASLQVFSFINIQKNFVYDLYGNAYSSLTDIPLYDEYGNEYYSKDSADNINTFYINKNGKEYNANDIYLTKGGYIVHPDENKVEYGSGAYDMILVDDEYYYVIISPYWNENGDLIVDYSEISPEYNIIITKEEQLEYQQEKGVMLFD